MEDFHVGDAWFYLFGCDRLLLHGELAPTVSYLPDIKESNHLGIPLLDEDFLYESLAKALRVSFHER